MLRLYWDNGKENGNYPLGFRVESSGCNGYMRLRAWIKALNRIYGLDAT